MTTRGATPFEFPQLIRNCGMKILKKVKVFLAPEQSSTYQIRDARNRSISKAQWNESQISSAIGPYIYPGWIQGVMIIHKPTAGNATNAARLVVGSTRKYSFSIVSDNAVTDGRVA